MAKPTKPEAAPVHPLPSSGGAWVRLADGTLIRDPAEHPPEDNPVSTTVEPPVKEV